MAKYNAMYIIAPQVEEEARKAIIDEINAIFTSRGTKDVKVNVWGMRTLAYEINDNKQGFYVDLEFDCPDGSAVAEYDRICNIKDQIIRHIIVRLPKGAK